MASLVSVILMLLLGNIVNWLLKVSSELSASILSAISDVFSGKNPLTNLTNLISKYIQIDGLQLDKVIFTIAFGVIILEVMLGALNSITAEATGKRSENPWNVLLNGIFAFMLILVFFGPSVLTNKTITNDGLLSFIANQFNNILSITFKSAISESISTSTSNVAGLNLTPDKYVLLLILTGGILGSILSGAIAIVERVFQLAAFIFLGPFALSLYSSSNSRDCASSWIKGIFSQYICLALSTVFWCASMNSLKTYLELDPSNANVEAIPPAVICVVLFSLAGNSEELLNVLGFKTMRAMDAARMVGSGLHTAFHAKDTLEGLAKSGIGIGKDTVSGVKYLHSKAMQFGDNNELKKVTSGFGNIMSSKISDAQKGLEHINSIKGQDGQEVGKKSVLGETTASRALNLANKLSNQGLGSEAITGFSALEGVSAMAAATGSNLRDVKTNGMINSMKNELSQKDNSMAIATGTFENANGARVNAPVAYAKRTRPVTEKELQAAHNKWQEACAKDDGRWICAETGRAITTDDIGKHSTKSGNPVTEDMVRTAASTKQSIFENANLLTETGELAKAGDTVPNGEMFIISPETQSVLQSNGFSINDLKTWNKTDVSGAVTNVSLDGKVNSDTNKLACIISDKSEERAEPLRDKLYLDAFGEDRKKKKSSS